MTATAAPVDNETILASGAAPDTVLLSLRVTLRPAAILATWVPWPPSDSVSVSTAVGADITHLVSVLASSRHTLFRLRTTLPSAKAGCVGSIPESITAMLTPEPFSNEPFAPTRFLRASRPRVAT